MMEHNKVIREEFSKQASSFGDKGLTLSSQDILDWSVRILPLEKEFRVLDVAAGTGHLSRAIAPRVKDVIAIDFTPKMLAYAREEATKSNLTNILIQEGKAEELPYKSECFDLVASRLAIHHFEEPIVQFREMVRVCKPGHRAGVIDLIAPDNINLAETYNRLERLRDPSHTVALSKEQMTNLIQAAGVVVETFEMRNVEVDFQRWVQMTGTGSGNVEMLKEELMKDIGSSSKTGMRPFIKNGDLKFLQVWAVVFGTKRAKRNANKASHR